MPTRPPMHWLKAVMAWMAFTVTTGALLGLANGLSAAVKNEYFRPDLRGVAGLVLQSNALDGGQWGLVVGVCGLAIFLVAWPVGRLALRSRSNATFAALIVVPLLALFGFIAYYINVEYLPRFLSVTSLVGNLLLGALFLVLWWFVTRAAGRYQARWATWQLPITWLAVLLLIPIVVLGGTAAARYAWKPTPAEDTPNILFVLVDTLRADRLGVYGHSRDTSPNIDRLAQDSWIFTEGVAQASWTKPSMASIFTGVYVNQTSVRPGSWAQADGQGAITVNALAPEHLTMTELLAAAGYRTGAFGNNHHLLPKLGFSQGFETYEWAQAQSMRLGPLRSVRKLLPRSWSERLGERELWSDWINQKFLEWLSPDDDGPFFAYLHHIDVHWPYRSPPPFSGMYSDVESPVDFNQAAFMPDTVSALRSGAMESLDPRILGAMKNAYDEAIRYVDDGLGKVFDELKRRGLYDNTLIIVTADHGEEFLEHGLLGHGESLYDEVIRVPLIVKFPCPGNHCGHRKIESQVELVDIFPTIMEAAGLQPPDVLVGRSLVDPIEEARNAFSEWDQSISLRTPQWKLIYDRRDDAGELYHLLEDPGETLDRLQAEHELGSILIARLLDFTATHRSLAAADASSVAADKRMLENLKALGYVQ